MVDIASLEIRIDTLEARNAQRDLDALRNSGDNLERSMGGLSVALRAAGTAFAGLSIIKIASDIFSVNREMQSLRTSMITATGSVAAANMEFEKLKNFKLAGIVGVKELAEDFSRLKNLALDASEKTITAYANIAAATPGKSVSDVVEAVADAVTGEMERLKEFGIKASQSGDQVTFSFKGVQTTIKNSSDAIQEYLAGIGNADFAGAVERKLQTIEGAFDHLGNSVSQLFDDMIPNSVENMAASVINGVADGITALDKMPGTLINIGDTTASVGDFIEATWITIRNTATESIDTIANAFPIIGQVGQAVVRIVSDVFQIAWQIVKGAALNTFDAIMGGINALGVGIGTAAAGIVQVFSQAFGKIKAMAAGLSAGVNAAMSGDFSFSALNTAWDKQTLSFKQVAIDTGAAMKTAFNVDYSGNLAKQIGSTATQLYSLRTMIDANNAALDVGRNKTHEHGKAHETAAGGVGKHAGAHKGLSDAQKASNQSMDEAKRLIDSLMTPTEKFNSEMGKAVALYNSGKIGLETLDRALEKYSDDLARANESKLIAVTAQERLNEAYQKASDLFAAGKISQAGYAEQLNSATDTFDKAIMPKVDSSTNKALEDYNSLINKINTSTGQLGATNNAVFDSALGGINTLVSAFNNMSAAIDANTQSQLDLNAAKAGALADIRTSKDDEFGKAIKEKKLLYDFDKASKKLAEEKNQTELSGARQIIGATTQMFDKKSSAAKALHGIEMGIAAAEMAMKAQSIASNIAATTSGVVAGAAKFFAQSGWAAFAGIAAMIGVIGALGGTTSSPSMPSIDTKTQGTVLGDKTKSSNTAENLGKIMEDIHASEYLALLNINESIKKLNDSILAAVTGIFQRGDLATPTLPANTSSMFVNTRNEISQNRLTGKGNTLGAISDGWQFDLSQFIETKRTKDLLFGHMVKTSTSQNAVSDQTNRDVTAIYKNSGDMLIEAGKIFGMDVKDVVNAIRIPDLDIDIKDMTGEEAIKTFNAYISTSIDQMAGQVFPELAQYQKIGEGLGETVGRVAADVGIVKSVFDNLHVTLPTTAVGLIAVSEALVLAADGTDKLTTNLNNFYNKFYSDTEQALDNFHFLTQNFARKGIELPTDRLGYRDATRNALAKAGTDSDILAAAKTRLDELTKAAFAPFEKNLEIRKNNAERYGGEDARLYKIAQDEAKAAVKAATKSQADYVAELQKSSNASAENANLLLEQSDNADAYYSAIEKGQKALDPRPFRTSVNAFQHEFSKVSNQAIPSSIEGYRNLINSIDTSTEAGRRMHDGLVMLAPDFVDLDDSLSGLKDELSQVYVGGNDFTMTIISMADAFGSADKAAQVFKDSIKLVYSGNDVKTMSITAANTRFSNNAKAAGLDGLRVEDAKAGLKFITDGEINGTLNLGDKVKIGNGEYSWADVQTWLVDNLNPIDAAQNMSTNTPATASTVQQSDSIKESQDKAKAITDFMRPFKDASATRGMDEYQKELYQLSAAYADNKLRANELKISTDDLALITANYNADVQAVADKKAKALSEFMQTFVDSAATQGMTDYQKELYSLNQTYVKNIDAAKKLGATEQQLQLITDANNAAIKARTDALAKERQQILQNAQTSNYLIGKSDYFRQLFDNIKGFYDLIDSLAKSGGSLEEAAQLINYAFTSGTDIYNNAVRNLQQSFKSVQNDIAQRGYTLSDKIAEIFGDSTLRDTQIRRYLAQMQADNYQDQLNAIDSLYQLSMDRYNKELDAITKIRDTAKSINDFIQKFRVSESTLSPESRLSEARAQYATTLAAAQAGDADAMSKVSDKFQAAVDAFKGYYASSSPTQDFIQQGLAALTALGNVSDKTPLEQTAASTANTVNELRYLQTLIDQVNQRQTDKLHTDLANIDASNQKVLELFKGAIYNLGSTYGVKPNQIDTAVASSTKGTTYSSVWTPPAQNYDTFGWGVFDRFVVDGQWMEAAHYAKLHGKSVNEMATRVEEWLGGSAEQTAKWLRENGFAKGGYYPGGLALVGEDGPELINFNQPGQVYTAPQTRALLNSGSDNKETIEQLKEQNRLLIALIDMTQAGFNATVQQNEKQADALDSLQRKQRIAEVA